ncbi:MAG: hypothetical protein Q9188_006913 [Gyalolechia gomerana]
MPQPPNQTPPASIGNSASEHNHVNEDFQSYDPTEKPDAANDKGSPNDKSPPKGLASADSPEGNPPSNGRRRTRTKVVAWDPRDLEDIYQRKEVKKEDWDTICRVVLAIFCIYVLQLTMPRITRPGPEWLCDNKSSYVKFVHLDVDSVTNMIIEVEGEKTAGSAGSRSCMEFHIVHRISRLIHPQKTGKSSTYSDSPQPASSSNGIRWATVNGSSPANNDPYQRRQSFDDDESSEEFELSSAPDSDHEGKPTKHFDHPARVSSSAALCALRNLIDTRLSQSNPQQLQTHPFAELPPQQPPITCMPVIIQEAPQARTPALSNFDEVAAQSRGKQIAPRQPPQPLQPLPAEMFDDRQAPPPPPPDFRAAQRMKRGREIEATGSESRSSSAFGKRRKQHAELGGAPTAMGNTPEGHVAPFNPAAHYPMPPQPPRLPQESELDELCIRFRATYRMMKAAYEEDQRMKEEQQRIKMEIYEASLGRANARAVHAEQRADEISHTYADQVKDDRMALRFDLDHLSQQAEIHRVEAKKWQEAHAKIREELAASKDALERERNSKATEHAQRPDAPMTDRPETSRVDAPQQDFKQDVERANAANDLLAEEVTKMRVDRAETRHKFEEIKAMHGDLTATLDDLVSQDLTDLTQKMIKKHVLDVKGVDQRLGEKIKEAGHFFDKYEHTARAPLDQPANLISNGPVVGEKPR